MGQLLFAAFNLAGGCVITALMILAARETAYPPAVGLALALLIGGTVTFFGTGLPLYVWWIKRQDRVHGDRHGQS